jgi:hypothetical protein
LGTYSTPATLSVWTATILSLVTLEVVTTRSLSRTYPPVTFVTDFLGFLGETLHTDARTHEDRVP